MKLLLFFTPDLLSLCPHKVLFLSMHKNYSYSTPSHAEVCHQLSLLPCVVHHTLYMLIISRRAYEYTIDLHVILYYNLGQNRITNKQGQHVENQCLLHTSTPQAIYSEYQREYCTMTWVPTVLPTNEVCTQKINVDCILCIVPMESTANIYVNIVL